MSERTDKKTNGTNNLVSLCRKMKQATTVWRKQIVPAPRQIRFPPWIRSEEKNNRTAPCYWCANLQGKFQGEKSLHSCRVVSGPVSEHSKCDHRFARYAFPSAVPADDLIRWLFRLTPKKHRWLIKYSEINKQAIRQTGRNTIRNTGLFVSTAFHGCLVQ